MKMSGTSRRPNVATSPRRDIPTSRRPHVVTSQRQDVGSTNIKVNKRQRQCEFCLLIIEIKKGWRI